MGGEGALGARSGPYGEARGREDEPETAGEARARGSVTVRLAIGCQSVVISGEQRRSATASGEQRRPTAISGYQCQSAAISGDQRQSAAISGYHR